MLLSKYKILILRIFVAFLFDLNGYRENCFGCFKDERNLSMEVERSRHI